MLQPNRRSLGLHGHGIGLELLSEPDELPVPPPHAGHLLGKTHAGGLDQEITVTPGVGWGEKNARSRSLYSRASRLRSPCRHARSRSSGSAGLAPRCWRPAAWVEESEERLTPTL